MLAPPLSKFTLLETHDIDEVREAMTRAYCRHKVYVGDTHTHTRLAARHNQVTLASLSLNYLTYGMDIAVWASELPDFFLVDFPIAGECAYRVGSREFVCRAGRGCVVSPGSLLRTHWSPDTQLVTVKIERVTLERYLGEALEGKVSEPLRFEPEFDCSSGARASLRSMVDFLVSEIDCNDAIRHAPLWCAQIERAVAVGLLTAQRHNYTDALQARAASKSPRYVSRAEAFIRANLANEIDVDDIAVAAGVPQRTLFAAYRRYKGLSPIAHYRALRLQAARADLVRPQARDTVASIACRWGFYHLGHFSRDYQQRFGELPSETLKSHS